MCGIVGYLGHQNAEAILLDSLRRLEYRGYDSAGIATLSFEKNAYRTEIRRAAGKLENLRAFIEKSPCPGNIGIGHTRWATHGKPTETNAHPHQSNPITLVHNGIIENHLQLREQLLNQGFVLKSDTDTEIVAHLISAEKKTNQADFTTATLAAVQQIKGAFALAILDENEPDTIICVKQSCPLIIGIGFGENFIASDFTAILPYTNQFIILEEGDMAVVKKDSILITNFNGIEQKRPIKILDWSPSVAEKNGFSHFMLKEIFEQPLAITDTLRERLSFAENQVILDGVYLEKLRHIDRICIVACGSSFHAGMIAKYQIEDLVKLPVDLDLASEFRYRPVLVDEKTLVVGISQSGETADTLAALRHAQSKNALLLSICNTLESSIPRFCHHSAGTLYTRAGPEISVASTKAFITQIVALHLLGLGLAQQKNKITKNDLIDEMNALLQLPIAIESVLQQDSHIQKIAQHFVSATDMLFLGRGALYPIALEGALKMKELSYIHAEGYAAGEMKHGAIALIDERMPVVILATQSPVYEKLVSNLEEVKSRGGRILCILDENDDSLKSRCEFSISIPIVPKSLLSAVAVVPLQLLAYHLANAKNLDVDQPRNLAKSVTVE
jgi:glutamine---fructose-6-phosphate transaminase (isomerizing)